MATKLYTIGVVVPDIDNYLGDPAFGPLANRVFLVQGEVTATNPDYAVMRLPFKAIKPDIIPGSIPGDVYFLEWQSGETFKVLGKQHFPTQEQVRRTFQRLLDGPIPQGEAEEFFMGGNNLPVGLGIFSWNLNIPDFLPNFPPAVWWIIAIVSGYQAYNQKKTLGKVALGAVTWLALAKAIKSSQMQNIKL